MPILNPFDKSIVTSAWETAEADVPSIHDKAFQVLCENLDVVRHGQYSRSVLLHGDVGSGKTHLLARFRAHVLKNSQSAVFVSVLMQSAPAMVRRHLRHMLVVDLLRRGADGLTQLDQVLLARCAEHPELAGCDAAWLNQLRSNAGAPHNLDQQLDRLLEWIEQQTPLPRNVRQALRLIAKRQHFRDAQDWLMGQSLPQSVLDTLGLQEDPEDQSPEESALEVVRALAQVAGSKIPLILCFDQIEALQAHSTDVEGLFSFGQMTGALHDQTSNVLLVSCVQSAFLDMMNTSIREANLHRTREEAYGLAPLTREQAQALVAARLNVIPQLSQERRTRQEPLWPLPSDTIERAFAKKHRPPTPRELVNFCKEEFRATQGGASQPAPARQSDDDFLRLRFEELGDASPARRSLRDSEAILAHGLKLLAPCLGTDTRVEGSTLRDVDMVFRHGSQQTLISLCDQTGNKLTSRLDRLRKMMARGELPNLRLVRDPRQPIPQTSARAREHWEALQPYQVRPLVDALAVLDAIRKLLSEAKAGDLTNDGNTVAPQTVEQWLAAHLPGSVRRLIDELLPERKPPAADQLFDGLVERVQKQRVIRLAEVAREMGRTLEELERCVQGHDDQFGRLQGPPVVLFDLAVAER